MKQEILGLQFDNVTMDEALAIGEGFLDGDRAAVVVTPNAEIGYDAAKDADFCALLKDGIVPIPRVSTARSKELDGQMEMSWNASASPVMMEEKAEAA